MVDNETKVNRFPCDIIKHIICDNLKLIFNRQATNSGYPVDGCSLLYT